MGFGMDEGLKVWSPTRMAGLQFLKKIGLYDGRRLYVAHDVAEHVSDGGSE